MLRSGEDLQLDALYLRLTSIAQSHFSAAGRRAGKKSLCRESMDEQVGRSSYRDNRVGQDKMARARLEVKVRNDADGQQLLSRCCLVVDEVHERATQDWEQLLGCTR